MRHLLAVPAALAALAAATPAGAESDAQAWGGIVASGTVRGDLFVWLEGQARATDALGGGTQFIIRPAVGARVARDAHVVAGYAFVRTDPAGRGATREHRAWQQVQFVAARQPGGAPLLVSRTRLEQRMPEGVAGTGWRLRQFVRLQAPVTRGRLLGVVQSEGFFNLNTTDWGARAGVDQWRNFVGVGIPFGPRLRLEPGYLHQRVRRPGADRTNHVLNATLFASF